MTDTAAENEIVETDEDRDVAAFRAALNACGEAPGLTAKRAGVVLDPDALARIRARLAAARKAAAP